MKKLDPLFQYELKGVFNKGPVYVFNEPEIQRYYEFVCRNTYSSLKIIDYLYQKYGEVTWIEEGESGIKYKYMLKSYGWQSIIEEKYLDGFTGKGT